MRTAVLCIGNELMMDEGVGPACARYLLSRYRFPEGVEVLDRATMGMALISDLREHDFVLVLDAVDVPGAEPGRVFSFEPEDVAPTPTGMTSLHDVRFADVLEAAELLGVECAGHCLGVQVENMSPSDFVMALTPKVAAALPLLAQAAVRYLRDARGIAALDLLVAGEVSREDLELPRVWGEPDATVMTRYLSEGLAAVGAGGRVVDDGAGGTGLVEVAGVDGDRLAGAAGRMRLQPGPDGLLAQVTPETLDCDCDALIGACQKALAGRAALGAEGTVR